MSEVILAVPQAVAEFEQRRLVVINQLKELGSHPKIALQVRQDELPTQVQQLAAILNPDSNPLVEASYYSRTEGRTFGHNLGTYTFVWEKTRREKGINGFTIKPRLRLLLNEPGYLELGGIHGQGLGMSTSSESGRYSPDIDSQRYDVFAKAANPAYTSYHLDLLGETATFFLRRISMPRIPSYVPIDDIGSEVF